MKRVQRVTAALKQREPDRVPTISCMDVQKYVCEALERPFLRNMYHYFISPFWSRIMDFISPLLNRIRSFEKDIREFKVSKMLADLEMRFDSTWNIYANLFRLRNSRQKYHSWGSLYKIIDDGYGNMDTPMYIRGMFEAPEDWRRFIFII